MDCHEAQKKFKYNTCEKTFHIKCRLKKHEENHKGTSASVKQCRYFSNQELCPYKAIGCTFLHVQTECCRFKDCCHSPTQPQHELELDFIMGRNPPYCHCVPHHIATVYPTGTFKALPGNLGSWFSVYNLSLTQLDEICKNKIGVPSKKMKKLFHFQTT